MQSGIAYAAGQLLAVVAPRTVLVVDAPTDWSLAGPLWELAQDDAPVDEILDVLVRRGIRSAPSFVIVRVESDAVRALVRGSVPVCFERVGEPVRLDATGATTWLEGLISGARRVLVGDVPAGGTLPYLVTTGVVLISGLALPCGPADQMAALPAGSETERQSTAAPDSLPAATPAASFTPPVPVPSGGVPLTPVDAREPRVVDLTRSESRAPARAFSGSEPRDWPSTPTGRWSGDDDARPELNGHVPAVFDPPAPDAPVADLLTPPASDSESPDGSEPRAQGTSAFPSPPAFEPRRFPGEVTDDPGELHDIDDDADDYDHDGDATPAPVSPESGRPVDDRLQTPNEPPTDEPVGDQPPAQVYDAAERFGGMFTPPAEASSSVAVPTPGLPSGTSSADGWDPDAHRPAWLEALPAEPPPGRDDLAVDDLAVDDPAVDDLAVDDQAVHGHSVEGDGGVDGGAVDDLNADDLLLAEPDDERPKGPSPVDLPNLDPPSLSSAPSGSSASVFGGVPDEWLPASDQAFEIDTDRPRAWLDGLGSASAPSGSDTETELGVVGEQDDVQGRDQDAVPARRLGDPRATAADDPEVWRSVDAGSEGGADGASEAAARPAFFRETAFSPESDVDEQADEPVVPADDAAPSPWVQNAAHGGEPSIWPAARRGFASRTGFGAGLPAVPGSFRSPAESDNGLGGQAAGPAREALREPPRLLGVWCDAGHVTAPDDDECRVCGLVVPPQAPILVARPPLGVLIFDNGDRVDIDRPVILGRDPKPVASPDPENPVLHPVASATGQVSRTHAEVRADGWDVVLTDLDAMNGTAVTLPGEAPVALEPGVPTVITPGARIDLGGETGFTFEVEG